jgi:hypothetical protein
MGLLVSLGVPHHKLEAMYVLFRVEPIIRYRGYGASQVFTTYWAFWYTHYNSLFIVDTLKILTWKQVGEERIKYLVLWNSHCKVSLNHSLYPNFWKWSCYFFITQAYYNTDCIKKMAESWWGGGCLHADRRLQRFVAHFLSAAEYSTPTNKHPPGANRHHIGLCLGAWTVLSLPTPLMCPWWVPSLLPFAWTYPLGFTKVGLFAIKPQKPHLSSLIIFFSTLFPLLPNQDFVCLFVFVFIVQPITQHHARYTVLIISTKE